GSAARGTRRRARVRLDRADLLLRARGRGSGSLPEDLLLPRPDRDHRLRLLRLGSLEGAARPVEAEAGRGPRELRRDPPGRDLRRADAPDGLALGEDLLGRLVDVEREAARALPGPLP